MTSPSSAPRRSLATGLRRVSTAGCRSDERRPGRDALTADYAAALDAVAGDVERRPMAAQARLREAERARLSGAVKLAEAEIARRRRAVSAPAHAHARACGKPAGPSWRGIMCGRAGRGSWLAAENFLPYYYYLTNRLKISDNQPNEKGVGRAVGLSKRMARPVGKWFVDPTLAVCANVSGLGARLPAQMELRAARSS